jgi:GDSL-like Lipase/Acylhydrolase
VFLGTGPIGCCPALREQNKTKECNAGGNYASVLYNQAVSSLLNDMSAEFTDMAYSFLDTSSVLLQYIQQPSAYGMIHLVFFNVSFSPSERDCHVSGDTGPET